ARERGIEDKDLVATVTALTAESIVESYTSFLIPSAPLSEVIFCGGGAHNRALLDMIRERLSPTAVKRVEDFNLSSDALEAMIFAILANETAYGHPSNLPAATGARSQAILGKIVPGRANSLTIFT
ncbi:MAG: anhydro-N-acetylmuramic acid kinase, partial [Candidatus Tectomicrobia bacterium]|nr:anhydro-N-acetylmuramic acid kinase [Candidatus Tectomicrobia bacterium]